MSTYLVSFEKLREVNIQRCNRWHRFGVSEWSLSDWAVAAAGEMGEACDVVKKLNRLRDGMVTKNTSDVSLYSALADEIADTIIYLDLLAARAGINLDEAIISKFNEVSNRYDFPEKL